jgi:KEOPS complex subunit Cgi121
MNIPPGRIKIRQARLTIRDRSVILHTIQSIARQYSSHIICFNAENMAGHRHAEAAMRSAQRSFFSKKPISNSIEMEALLFAAGSRQCDTAALFGIHENVDRIFVCCCPEHEGMWQELSQFMHFVTEEWDEITPEKEDRIKSLFNITDEELALVGRARIVDLVLERIALLEVYR